MNGLYGNILQPETMKDKLAAFLVASRGNHQTLKDFLSAIRKEKNIFHGRKCGVCGY